MKLQYSYRKPLISEISAPYIPLIISDPLENTTIEEFGLIDTGFDGELLIPLEIYNKLNLKAFEYGIDVVSIAETASGEQLRLITASAAVKIKGDEITSIITIDSHLNCKEILIGRKFLQSYHLALNGPEEELQIEFHEFSK